MALTNNNLELIKAIAKNDMHAARKAALSSLMEDTSKKNESIISQYRRLLTGNASTMMSNMPADMQTYLVGEAPSGFDAKRYYLRETEEKIVEEIMRMKLVAEEMALRHIPYRNTTLLYGDSGTGKTELGRYIAYRLNLPLFYVSFVSAIDSYMGSTAKNIHKIFDFCKSIPCVLMLDEIDCVAAKRSADGSRGVDGELERTTITLMQELDQLPNNVVLLAATNRLDVVDEAMLRRFSVRQKVLNMTQEDLVALMNQFLTATDTSKYVDESAVARLASGRCNPGFVMPDLIKAIGKGIYEEKKDELLSKADADDGDVENLWAVSYIWKKNIAAETEEDAIAIARRERNNYAMRGATEEYAAKRAEFIYPDKEQKK